jgi:hypothetical protein
LPSCAWIIIRTFFSLCTRLAPRSRLPVSQDLAVFHDSVGWKDHPMPRAPDFSSNFLSFDLHVLRDYHSSFCEVGCYRVWNCSRGRASCATLLSGRHRMLINIISSLSWPEGLVVL